MRLMSVGKTAYEKITFCNSEVEQLYIEEDFEKSIFSQQKYFGAEVELRLNEVLCKDEEKSYKELLATFKVLIDKEETEFLAKYENECEYMEIIKEDN